MAATAEQMNNRKRWLEALRSGKYRQAQGHLRGPSIQDSQVEGFCCLGVACDVLNIRHTIHNGEHRYGNGGFGSARAFVDFTCGTLPRSALLELGLDSNDPLVFHREEVAVPVTDLNDTFNLNFTQIADLLEPQLLRPDYDGTRPLSKDKQ